MNIFLLCQKGSSLNCPGSFQQIQRKRLEAFAEGVKKFNPGERFYIAGRISGSYAEKAICRESQIHPLPQKLSFAQGAAVSVPYGTAYLALFQRARAHHEIMESKAFGKIVLQL